MEQHLNPKNGKGDGVREGGGTIYIYMCMHAHIGYVDIYIYMWNVDQEIVAVAACKNAPAPLCAPLGGSHAAEPPPNPPAA